MATKQQLKEAYCRSINFEGTTAEKNAKLLADKEVYDARVTSERESFQTVLDSLPVDGKDKMKDMALKQLAKEAEEQLELDNLSLDNARLKLWRKLNPMAKEFYEKEVEELMASIKERTILLNNL